MTYRQPTRTATRRTPGVVLAGVPFVITAIGDSSKVTVGQAVKALGNAGGTGTLTPAAGTVTGIGKSITVGNDPTESIATQLGVAGSADSDFARFTEIGWINPVAP